MTGLIQIHHSALFVLVSAILSFANFLNSMAIYPRVMRDEWYYSMHSRNVPFELAEAPNYLYFFIMRGTNLCGDNFLTCGKLINYIAMTLSALVIWKMLLSLTSKTTANYTAGIFLISPLGVYVNLFMPESLFILFFILMIYFLAQVVAKPTNLNFSCYVLTFSFLILIKPHALFLVPSILVGSVTALKKSGNDLQKKYALYLGVVGILFSILIKSFFGYLAAGKEGISLFGTYTNYVANSPLDEPLQFLQDAASNGLGLMFAICLVFGFVIFLLLTTELNQANPSATQSTYLTLRNFTFVGTVTLLPIMAITSTVLAGNDEYELSRVHERYINYFFVMYLIMMALWMKLRERHVTSSYKILAVTSVFFFMLLVTSINSGQYSFNPISSPFSQGLVQNANIKIAMIIVVSLLTVIYLTQKSFSPNIYFYLVLPILFLSTTQPNQGSFSIHKVAYKYDQAGIFADNYFLQFPNLLNNRLVVVAPEIAGIYQVLIRVDEFAIEYRVIPEGSSLDVVISNFDTILMIGDYKTPSDYQPLFKSPAYSLLSRTN